jgi:hypothetical protein
MGCFRALNEALILVFMVAVVIDSRAGAMSQGLSARSLENADGDFVLSVT